MIMYWVGLALLCTVGASAVAASLIAGGRFKALNLILMVGNIAAVAFSLHKISGLS